MQRLFYRGIDDGTIRSHTKKGESKMINEFICNLCGWKIRKLDYPTISKARKAMKIHIEHNHGLNYKRGELR